MKICTEQWTQQNNVYLALRKKATINQLCKIIIEKFNFVSNKKPFDWKNFLKCISETKLHKRD